MKGIFGTLLFFIGLGGLIRTVMEDVSGWWAFLFAIALVWGLDKIIEDKIETNNEKYDLSGRHN